jgi:hypothetical protein
LLDAEKWCSWFGLIRRWRRTTVFLRLVYVCSCTTPLAEYGFWKTGLLRNGLSGLYSNKWGFVLHPIFFRVTWFYRKISFDSIYSIEKYYLVVTFYIGRYDKSSYLFNRRHHQIYYFKFFNLLVSKSIFISMYLNWDS